MDITKIKKDLGAIDHGVWVDNIPNAGNLRLKVRGLTSSAARDHRSTLERAVAPEDRLDDGTFSTAISLEILGKVLADVVLIDWEGLTDDGREVPYNPALAREWCTNRAYETFADAVVWAARKVDGAREKTTEMVVKNS